MKHPKPLTAEQQELATAHFNEAMKLARFAHAQLPINLQCRITADDLQGVAGEALCRAAQTFDAGTGLSFASYLNWKIEYGIRDWMRAQDGYTRRDRQRVRAGELPEINHVAESLAIPARVVNTQAAALASIDAQRIGARFGYLQAVYIDEISHREMADWCGVHPSRISQRVRKELAQARTMFAH